MILRVVFARALIHQNQEVIPVGFLEVGQVAGGYGLLWLLDGLHSKGLPINTRLLEVEL